MVNGVVFPGCYRHIYAVWLFRKIAGGRCDICGAEAGYEVDMILEGERSRLIRCDKCFEKLAEFRRILLVEEGYWRHVLSERFHGLRVIPKPLEELPEPEPVGSRSPMFLGCDLCDVYFATENDLKSHVEAWHKQGVSLSEGKEG